jgi:hypothetical protein
MLYFIQFTNLLAENVNTKNKARKLLSDSKDIIRQTNSEINERSPLYLQQSVTKTWRSLKISKYGNIQFKLKKLFI